MAKDNYDELESQIGDAGTLELPKKHLKRKR